MTYRKVPGGASAKGVGIVHDEKGRKLWAGQVRLVETKIGSRVLKLDADAAGSWNSDNVMELVRVMVKQPKDVMFDGWSIWLDADDEKPFSVELAPGKPVSPAQLAKVLKEADEVILGRADPRNMNRALPKIRFIRAGGKKKGGKQATATGNRPRRMTL